MNDLSLEITELKPAEISGPHLSHHLGRVVLKLPEPLNLSYLSVRFSPQGAEGKAGRITFHERGEAAIKPLPGGRNFGNHQSCGDASPWLGGGGAQADDGGPPLEIQTLFRQLTEIKSLLGKAQEAGEYELSEFDRPARLIIHLTRNSVLDDIRADLDLPPAPQKLEIDLAIEQDWGFLEFSYEEICNETGEELARQKEEAKAGLIGWVKDFLPHYQWRGANQPPPPGAQATRYGFISPPENRPEMAGNYYASFEMPRKEAGWRSNHCPAAVGSAITDSAAASRPDWDDDEKSTLDFLTFTVKTSAAGKTEIRPGNRLVGGRRGYESRKLSRLDESAGQNPLPGKELVLYLEWQDMSEDKQAGSKAVYDAALYASVTREELADLPYYLGLWDMMLDSVQELDEAGKAGDQPAGVGADSAQPAPGKSDGTHQ